MSFWKSGPAHPDLLDIRAEYANLAAAQQDRIARMERYRREGSLARESEAKRGSLDILEDYGRQARQTSQEAPRHGFRLPLAKAVTLKHAYRISGQLPDIVVDERAETEEERYRSDVMEKIGWGIMRASRADTTFASGAWDGSELGSTVFDLYWDEGLQLPRFRRCDPVGCLAVQGLDDPHDFQRFYRAWDAPLRTVAAEYRDQTFRGQPVLTHELAAHHTDGGGEDMVRIVQVCGPQHVIRFAMGADLEAGIVGLYEFQHNYGFVPYFVIPNIGPYEDVWGWADYEFIRELAHYIPALLSREADVLRSVANGGVIEQGTGAMPHTIKKVISEGGVLPSKREGSVQPIEAPEMPSFHETHSQRAFELFKMLGFSPDAAWGLPGSGSGTDRGMQLQPLMEYTAMKKLNWQAGLARMFGAAYRMIEQNMSQPTKVRGYKVSRTGKRTPFLLDFGPGSPQASIQKTDEDGFAEPVDLPNTPKELFDGDYDVRFSWRDRVDPEDPQYVMAEMNKFTQGAQSLETTLENLGFEAPQDEMIRIEKEAERFPWINQGLVSLLMAQLRGNAQGTGGGAPTDAAGAVGGAMETMAGLGGGGQSGALNADAGVAAMGGTGEMYGSA